MQSASVKTRLSNFAVLIPMDNANFFPILELTFLSIVTTFRLLYFFLKNLANN